MDCTSGATASDQLINPSGKLQAKCLCKAVQFNITRPNVPSDFGQSPSLPDILPATFARRNLGATREKYEMPSRSMCLSLLPSRLRLRDTTLGLRSAVQHLPHPAPDPIFKSSGPIVVLDLDAIPEEVPLSTYESSKGFIGISAGSVVRLYLCMRM